MSINNLDTRHPWSILVFLKIQQHLSEALLARPTRTALQPLPTDINQFRNALPARASHSSVFTVGKELLCLLAGALPRLVRALVVRFVVVVYVLLGLLDGLSFAFFRGFGAAGEFGVAFRAPFTVVAFC